LKYELKITKEAYSALKQQVNAYDGKISSLASQVELFQVKSSLLYILWIIANLFYLS
jgi:hypothetical protein